MQFLTNCFFLIYKISPVFSTKKMEVKNVAKMEVKNIVKMEVKNE